MKKFNLLLCGLAMTGGLMSPALAQQLLRGANGSASVLAPIKLTKQTTKLLSVTEQSAVRTDYVKSVNQYFVLIFDQIPTDEVKGLIGQYAVTQSYVPENGYVYSAANAEKAVAGIKQAVNGKITIVAEGALPANFKLATALYDLAVRGSDLTAQMKDNGLVVSVFHATDKEALVATLDKWGVPYDYTPYEEVRVKQADLTLVRQLAAIPYVTSITVYEEPEHAGFAMNWITQPNRIQMVNYDRRGPIGNGVTFANWETYGSADYYDVNTYGRNVAGLTDNSDNAHGTNCGLIVSGANNIEEYEHQGMAPGVQIIGMNGVVGPWGTHVAGISGALAAGYTPLVSNHSVGWARRVDEYSQTAATIDQIIHSTNDYMCCYPTGNWAYGQATYGSYTDADYGTITGDIKTNKNALAIHSTIYPGVDVTWANFGPTKDGRMKPDICAQGSGGTSYASPGVAGLISVLVEQFKTTYPTKAVHMDVCKAVMLNTALDVRTYVGGTEAGRGIDYRTGFGEINSPAAVKAIVEQRVNFEQTVANGGTVDTQIAVPAGQTELKVMLYWNDPAATVGASSTLINDLDLEVIAPDGTTTYLPWTLNPSPDSVTKPATRTVNRRDNVEQVILTAATSGETLPAGNYTVRVKGYRVPQGPQRFVITWENKARGIEMTSIPEGFRLAQGQEILLSWDMTVSTAEDLQAPNFVYGTMTPKVYYRTAPTQAWTLAAASTGVQYWTVGNSDTRYGQVFGKNFMKWRVPDDMPATATLQFKVEAGDLSVISNNAHVSERMIARPQILALSGDKVKLSWEAPKNTTVGKYYIYALYDKYMQVVDSVDMPTTTKEVAAPAGVTWNQNHLFAVAAVDGTAKTLGQRSLPVGLDPLNSETTNSEDLWQSSYLLCMGDTLQLRTNALEGNVQWYRDGAAITGTSGQGRVLPIDRSMAGTYKYTISDGAGTVIYNSPETSITSSTVNISDTTVWGDYKWKGYVFYNAKGDVNDLPLLKDNLGLYGRFELDKLAFNSHTDLFSWSEGNVQNIPGYVGCVTGPNHLEHVIVMKRKGFVPGTYTFSISRASGQAQVFVRNGSGTLVRSFTSVSNAYEASIGSAVLDENSTVEIHWIGNHFIFNSAFSATSTVTPGRVATGLDFWLNPSKLTGNDGDAVTKVFDAYPQQNVLVTSSTDAVATLQTAGSNYNPTLKLLGTGAFFAPTRSTYTGNATTDFIVVNAELGVSNARLVSFGSTASTSDLDNAESYVAALVNNNGLVGGARNNVVTVSSSATAGTTRLVTIRRSATTANISVNGKAVTGTGTAVATAFNLERMSLGGSWNAETPAYGKANIGEFVHYNATLSDANENKVRSYLAVKHGITLDHDYVNSRGTVVYPTSSVAYKYQITGVGSDLLSSLVQKQSVGKHTNGTDAMMILAIGDLATTNAENTAAFAADRNFYVMGASSNSKPTLRQGNFSRVHYFLKRTLNTTSTSTDELSFYVPQSLKRTDYEAYLQVSNEAFADTVLTETSNLIKFEDYTAPDGTALMRAKYTPETDSTYIRVIWRSLTVGIADVMTDGADFALGFDKATSEFIVNVKDAVSIDVTDVQGRLVMSGAAVKNGRVKAQNILSGVYIVKVKRQDAADVADKVKVEF